MLACKGCRIWTFWIQWHQDRWISLDHVEVCMVWVGHAGQCSRSRSFIVVLCAGRVRRSSPHIAPVHLLKHVGYGIVSRKAAGPMVVHFPQAPTGSEVEMAQLPDLWMKSVSVGPSDLTDLQLSRLPGMYLVQVSWQRATTTCVVGVPGSLLHAEHMPSGKVDMAVLVMARLVQYGMNVCQNRSRARVASLAASQRTSWEKHWKTRRPGRRA